MKPLPGDYHHKLLISGDELEELKKHTGSMAEAFGLDRKIEKYMGTRPITLYRWDLDCLMDVIDLALKDERDYPDKSAQEFQTLSRLGARLHQEYDSVYGEEKAPSVEKTVTLAKGTSSRKPDLPTKARKAMPTGTLYQFKITLLDITPAIWRRIQVPDCTLADLHEYIQAAFGWENYHLHQFDIDGERYSQPAPDGDDFGMEFKDETDVLLSKLIPKSGRPSRWIYEYDFGDDWRHEVQFEGFPPADPKAKYPLCLEGERACPPEDCGGSWGYADYLAALADPKHEQHDELLEWRGPFDAEAFDVKKATKEMRKVK